MLVCVEQTVSLQLKLTGESMKIEYNQRGKQLFKDLLAIVIKDKTLMLIPAIANLMVLSLAYGIIHPVLNYEKMQLQLHALSMKNMLLFYIAILFLLFLRNIIKGFGVCILNLVIDRKNNIGSASIIKQLRSVSWRILRTMTFISFFGVYYRIIDLLLSFKSKRKLFGGSTIHYSHIILIPFIIFNDPMPTYKALQQAGRLSTETWGKPPLKLGFSMTSISLLFLFISILPALIVLAFSSHLTMLVWISISLSFILLFTYTVIHHAINQYLSYALYRYAKNRHITYPFSLDTLKKALIAIITDESLNHGKS